MKLRLQYKGVFDLKDLYGKLIKHLKSNQFDFMETTYKDKGKEVEIEGVFEQKTTPYVKIAGEIALHAWDVKEVEVDGRVMNQGRVQIEMSGETVKDYDNKFKTDKQKNMKGMYEKIKKKELDGIEKTMITVLVGAEIMLKKELKMDV